jgi:predicted DNA-binding transcriptional regulator YafY
LASFHNPEFYSKQALRFSTFATPRIISCAEVSDNFITVPRGCEDAVLSVLDDHNVNYRIDDNAIIIKDNSITSDILVSIEM